MKVLAAAAVVLGLVACNAEKAAEKAPEKAKSAEKSDDNSNNEKKSDTPDGEKKTDTPPAGDDADEKDDSKPEIPGTKFHGLVGKGPFCETWSFKNAEEAEYASKKLNLNAGACPASNELKGAIVKTCANEEKSQKFYENGNYDKPVKTVSITLTRVVYAKGNVVVDLTPEEVEAAEESGEWPEPKFKEEAISEAKAAQYCPVAAPAQ